MSSSMCEPTLPDCTLSNKREPFLVAQLTEAVGTGGSVLVTGVDSTAPLLAAITRVLTRTRTRVLHVRPPFDLTSFMDQLATADDAPKDVKLERGFDALTTTDAGCDRIALLVEDAHLLPDATLRYIELALRAGPHLHVIFAGQSGIADTLALEGFAWLRGQVSLRLFLSGAEPKPAGARSRKNALPVGPLPASSRPTLSLRDPYRMSPPRLLACAAIAAGLGVLIGRSFAPPPGPLPAAPSEASTAPAVATQADNSEPEPDHAPMLEAGLALGMPEHRPSTAQPRPEPLSTAAPARVGRSQALAPVARVQVRPSFVNPERVADHLPVPGQDGQRCRSTILRLQLGETSTDDDRTFLRNGCR